jgi:hypothetical protein
MCLDDRIFAVTQGRDCEPGPSDASGPQRDASIFQKALTGGGLSLTEVSISRISIHTVRNMDRLETLYFSTWASRPFNSRAKQNSVLGAICLGRYTIGYF